MYRLAEMVRSIYRILLFAVQLTLVQYGITELQDLAYDEVISQLRPENIVEEAFSSFFARLHQL